MPHVAGLATDSWSHRPARLCTRRQPQQALEIQPKGPFASLCRLQSLLRLHMGPCPHGAPAYVPSMHCADTETGLQLSCAQPPDTLTTPPPQKRPLLNLRLFASCPSSCDTLIRSPCDVGLAWELDPELELPGHQPLDSLPSRSDTSDRLRPSLDKASFVKRGVPPFLPHPQSVSASLQCGPH